MFRESLVFSLATGRQQSDPSRRSEGLRVMEACCDVLTDRAQNDDGEQLTNQGSLEIAGRARVVRSPQVYVYAVRIRVARSLVGNEGPQVWGPWAKTRIVEKLPTVPGSPPTPLDVVDVIDPL